MDLQNTENELDLRRSAIKPINDRISKLREESVTTSVSISSERAQILTEFYKNEQSNNISSIPIKRALAFRYLMDNISLPIEEGQLIVGLRGTGVKEVPTFPEVCCHSINDLTLLSNRKKNPYLVDDSTKDLYENEIIPYWDGKSIRETLFQRMTDEWINVYSAGIFTEFMEQRAPGHTAGGERIFTMGVNGVKEQIREKKAQNPSQEELDELKAMEIVADAIISYAHRYAEKLTQIAQESDSDERKAELLLMANICYNVPENPPSTFWEALQHYWFIHIGVITESNPWDSFNPGRLDYHLYPFYEKEIESGDLDHNQAKELLEAFWLKFNNHPAPPKVGITALESNTYNDFTKINIGGNRADGSTGINDVSYLLLDVLQDMRTLQPNTAVLISKQHPNRFLGRALEISSQGFGEPPFFNYDAIEKILLRQGKSIKDARLGGVSGCVETGAFGTESYILTGYFNLPKVLEITLNNGIDPRTGVMIGIETGSASQFTSYNELYCAFEAQLRYFIEIKMRGNDIIEQLYAEQLPVPFLSLWIDDCVISGRDYNSGGTRYNTQYIQVVGLGTITDSLSSLQHNIFDTGRFQMNAVLESLRMNYEKDEIMRQVFLNRTPKFGNDNNNADNIAKSVLNTCIDIIENYPLTPIRKASRRVYGLPTTVHVYFGNMCGATPDGRKAETALSEGISPVQGADRKGISAVFRSIGKLDHIRTGGTLLNQKLSPDLFHQEVIMTKMIQLIRVFFTMDSHHVQFNVISVDLLREAQENPEFFQDLMVRVAGYSDYFINLPKGLQDEIIARTEQSHLTTSKYYLNKS